MCWSLQQWTFRQCLIQYCLPVYQTSPECWWEMSHVFDPHHYSLEKVRGRMLKEILHRKLTCLIVMARIASFSARDSSTTVTITPVLQFTISANSHSEPFGVLPKTDCRHLVPRQTSPTQGLPYRPESVIQIPPNWIPFCTNFLCLGIFDIWLTANSQPLNGQLRCEKGAHWRYCLYDAMSYGQLVHSHLKSPHKPTCNFR